MGKHLYLQNFKRASNSNILINKISLINCDCLTNIDFNISNDSCSYTFTVIETVDGDLTYEWAFGDGSYGLGDTVNHSYIFSDTFEVCLQVYSDQVYICDVCKDVTVPDSLDCDNCEPSVITVRASQCESESDSTDVYGANASFGIPKGYSPCGEELFVNAEGAEISGSSYSIEDYDASNDLLNISLFINPASSSFENPGTSGHVTLCGPNGELICYELNIRGTTCDNCIDPITINLVCNDPDPTDSVLVYEGSFDISALDPNSEACPGYSEHPNFQTISSDADSNGVSTVTYSYSTTNLGSHSFSSMFCFEDPTLNTTCIEVIFNIPNPFPILPDTCVEVWDPKYMSCDTIDSGDAIFHFSMEFEDNIQTNGYELCGDSLFGSIDSGYVSVNSGSVIGTRFVFDVDIITPCEVIGDDTVQLVLKLYFCDSNGDVICYLFPLKLYCNQNCGQAPRSRIFQNIEINDQIKVYPNPFQNELTIYYENPKHEDLRYNIYDLKGMKVLKGKTNESKTMINLDFLDNGIYLLKFENIGKSIKLVKMN